MAIAFRSFSSARAAFSALAFSRAAFSALVSSSRGVFSSSAKTVTFAAPAAARGDVLVALVAHNAADAAGATPAGWTLLGIQGSGADVLSVYVRMVDGTESTSIAFTCQTVANEWMGELVAFRGTSPGVIQEDAASASFSASTSLTSAGVTSQQAINLILAVWTCSGSPVLTPPTGFTLIDSLATSIVSPRSILVAYKLASATGALTFLAATAGANTTGRSFVYALRDRIPIAPAPLVDLVPGNIGLIGKDTRPAR